MSKEICDVIDKLAEKSDLLSIGVTKILHLTYRI